MHWSWWIAAVAIPIIVAIITVFGYSKKKKNVIKTKNNSGVIIQGSKDVEINK